MLQCLSHGEINSKLRNSGGGKRARKGDNAFGGFEAFIGFGDQRHTNAIAARINAMGFTAQVASRQHSDIIFGIQPSGEVDVGNLHMLIDPCPQIKAGIGQGDVSKLEQRPNLMLQTLARYIEATGGRLRVVAEYGEDRVEIELSELPGTSA